MTDIALPSRRVPAGTTAATWALFVGLALMMIGNGLQSTLLGIRGESEEFSTVALGLVMACYYVGFLYGSKMAGRTLALVGHVRVFAALASVASASVLIHAVLVNPWSWALMRAASGACFAGLYVVAESWLNDLATNENRGRLLAVYMVVTMGGVGVGQLLIDLADPDGFELFVVSSVLVSLSLVPLALSDQPAPVMGEVKAMGARELWHLVPVGFLTSFLVGAASGALFGMGAVYASSAGLTDGQVARFIGALMLGAVVWQFPIGSASDHHSRRFVMLLVSVGAVFVSAALRTLDPSSGAALWAMFFLGGLAFPLYSLGVAYTNDWLKRDQILGASAAMVFVTGVGSVVGPLAAALVIQVGGNDEYFSTLVVVYGVLAAVLGLRILLREPVPIVDQTDFVPYSAGASASTAQVLIDEPCV